MGQAVRAAGTAQGSGLTRARRKISIWSSRLTRLKVIKEPSVPYRAAPSWLLQDAKARFSSVVDAALAGVPQHVTRRGQPAVVILSEDDYARLQRTARAAAPGFIDHLLAMPADDRSFERGDLAPRAVSFDDPA